MLGLPWTLEEQRSVIKFLLLEGEKPSHIFERLQKSFSKACISRSTFYCWVSQFRSRQDKCEGQASTGRPAEAVTPTMVANVEVFINKDRSDIAGGS